MALGAERVPLGVGVLLHRDTANWDALIECLPGLGAPIHAPVRAGRHLMEKFHRTVLGG
jgi:hypothetical protein